MCGREGVLDWFGIVFSRERSEGKCLVSGDDSWERRGIGYYFVFSIVICLGSIYGEYRDRIFWGGYGGFGEGLDLGVCCRGFGGGVVFGFG